MPTTALVAVGGSLVSDAQDWHPPGPLFLVFAFAACASLPSDGADVLAALVVAGASAAFAAFAVLVGGAGAWWRRVRGWQAPAPGPVVRRVP